MKTTAITLLAVVSTAMTASSALAQEKTVAFKVPAQQPPRYLTFAGKSGITIQGTQVSKKQVFTLNDKNGGDLAEADEVTIKHSKFLQEKDGAIAYGSKADASAKFTIKKADAGISLQTASGKFLAAKSPTEPLTLVDTADTALVFEVVAAQAPADKASSAGGENADEEKE